MVSVSGFTRGHQAERRVVRDGILCLCTFRTNPAACSSVFEQRACIKILLECCPIMALILLPYITLGVFKFPRRQLRVPLQLMAPRSTAEYRQQTFSGSSKDMNA